MTQQATQDLHAYLLAGMDGRDVPTILDLREIIAAGADINAPDSEGLTPLLRCLSWPYMHDSNPVFKNAAQEVLALLLENGADMEARTPDGKSIHTLVAHWADVNYTAKVLRREALRRSVPVLRETVQAIHPSWPEPGTPVNDSHREDFIGACLTGNVSHVAYLLYLYPEAVNWRFDVDSRKGYCGMMEAMRVMKNSADIIRLFIRYGADLNAQAGNGQTVLHLAAFKDPECIELLIEHGADEHIRNDFGKSSYDTAKGEAEIGLQRGQLSLCRFLHAMDKAIAAREEKRAAIQDIIKAAASERAGVLQSHKKRDGARFRL